MIVLSSSIHPKIYTEKRKSIRIMKKHILDVPLFQSTKKTAFHKQVLDQYAWDVNKGRPHCFCFVYVQRISPISLFYFSSRAQINSLYFCIANSTTRRIWYRVNLLSFFIGRVYYLEKRSLLGQKFTKIASKLRWNFSHENFILQNRKNIQSAK